VSDTRWWQADAACVQMYQYSANTEGSCSWLVSILQHKAVQGSAAHMLVACGCPRECAASENIWNSCSPKHLKHNIHNVREMCSVRQSIS
jgi:hypothetical protein